ncbi:transcriptional repressor DicA [Oligella ureolytica]|uniref:Helix-turn-helix transcriptional regulator n=1 Tax=Oligella ureolytica TaxID=90244 RepID=A0A378XJF8_9BURK|nr:helix-turn-helix transcriptional regulator [Oligella ureolytica]QPT39704.1 helix-turn-helix transcriptional regulator [Oligella ureolytica]SUA52373.1 transcriptional repressor DicA [Oligella ureolytica]SUA57254.1 transcriptional repressor DicA [Oligella ureolytica]
MDLFEIGELIRTERKALGLTQEALAKKVGVSRRTVSQLELGQVSDLGIRKVMALLGALGLELQATPIRVKRPTLDELQKERAAEKQAELERLSGRKMRV